MSPAVTLTLPQTLALQLPDPLTIHLPLTNSIVDGETFTVGDGTQAIVFEFDVLGDGVRLGNTSVAITSNNSQEDVARQILRVLNLSGLSLQPTMLGGTANIDLGGGSSFSLTLPPGSTLLQTGPLSLQPPVSGGSAIADTNVFYINDGPTRYTFEFVDQAVRPGIANGSALPSGNVAVTFQITDTQVVLGNTLLQALRATPGLSSKLDPILTTGTPVIHLGAASTATLNTSLSHLSQTGVANALPDGRVLVLTDGTQVQRFELDFNGVVTPQRPIVNLSSGSTPHQIAQEILHEIVGVTPSLGLTPAELANRVVHLGGTAAHRLDASQLPSIRVTGTGGAIPDGQTFLVTEAGRSVRFEFVNVSRRPGIVNGQVLTGTGNRTVVFSDSTSTQVIVQNTRDALATAVSGLNLFPVDLGGGVIALGGSETDVVTLRTNLTQTVPLTVRTPAAGGGVTGVVDGETFTITECPVPRSPRVGPSSLSSIAIRSPACPASCRGRSRSRSRSPAPRTTWPWPSRRPCATSPPWASSRSTAAWVSSTSAATPRATRSRSRPPS